MSSRAVGDHEKRDLADRVATIERSPTEIRILAVTRLLWSGWELDDGVACVQSVRTGVRYVLVLTPGPDAPEPTSARWLLDLRREWIAAVEDLDRFITIFQEGSGQSPHPV
jgi:hypothetical protein